MTNEQLASLAQSIRDNDAFQLALTNQRTAVMEALAKETDPNDAETIRQHQATVRVIDDLRDNLRDFIREGTARKPPGIA